MERVKLIWKYLSLLLVLLFFFFFFKLSLVSDYGDTVGEHGDTGRGPRGDGDTDGGQN
ncbi:uncharacterized protein G2W53_011198 [Senna tora]|uniref:Uncharacterized protein n=1 Tax=Senna tora TaxID=362788 RepID=A0A835CAS5_9FABA|nr:uncharacterized protein G2W53_011198 [Senna tora]